MNTVRRLHLIVGALALLTFLATGQVMDKQYNHLEGMADAPRMLHRSAHIYILLSGGTSLMLGLYLKPRAKSVGRVLQTIGSMLLLTTPVLFTLAFFYEPWLSDLVRPYARPAMYSFLAGVLMHAVAHLAPSEQLAAKLSNSSRSNLSAPTLKD